MKKTCKKSYLYIAFGIGCALVCILPSVWVTRVLAVTIILLGIACCRR